MRSSFIVSLAVVLAVFGTTSMVRAAAATINESKIGIYNSTTITDPCPPGNPARCTTTSALLQDLANRAVDTLFYIAGIAGVIMIFIGGVSYLTAGGDEAKVSKARRTLVYAIIAIVIGGASWMIQRATLHAVDTLNTNPNATSI